ncbi:MAG: MFS transporter [SAR202 cluster bacterium]|nr:MFS transporter [SAR202 cluster bacterium]
MFRKSNGHKAVAATAPYPPTDRAVYWHYAWVIVAIVSVMQMVGASTQMAFGVFIQPLSDNFGWGQGSITLAYAISSIVTALASPLAGWMGDRYGGRRTLALGSILFVIGMVLTGIINELWQLYLAFGFLIGIAKAIFLVPLIPASMAWFRRHLGLGMGVVMAGWGAGPALVAPLMGWMIGDLGWQTLSGSPPPGPAPSWRLWCCSSLPRPPFRHRRPPLRRPAHRPSRAAPNPRQGSR